jgi:hypothetical protein
MIGVSLAYRPLVKQDAKPDPVLTETKTQLSWPQVARVVSQRLGNGKTYSGQYVREVARGWRVHKKIGPVLQELGLMDSSVVAV